MLGLSSLGHLPCATQLAHEEAGDPTRGDRVDHDAETQLAVAIGVHDVEA
jgi:hypothetical protein